MASESAFGLLFTGFRQKNCRVRDRLAQLAFRLDMNPALPLVLTTKDRCELDRIAQELEDPDIPTDRLVEMLDDIREMAQRYQCDLRLTDNV